ncbi:MAG: M23 family metallopeptidase [Chitinophagales bacterium]
MRSIITFLSILILLLNTQVAFSQFKRNVEVSSKYDKVKDQHQIIAENNTFSSYVLKVTFTTSSNMKCINGNTSFTKTILPGRNVVTTIRRIDPLRKIFFRYETWVIPGCHRPKPKVDYPYLLPVKNGDTTKFHLLSNFSETYQDMSPPKDWYALQFSTTKGDTVFAARRGRITKVVYEAEKTPDENIIYTSRKNYLVIEHKDGTFADYSLFENDGIFVEPGSIVEAGQALGTIGGETYLSGSHLRFAVRYFLEQPEIKHGIETGKKQYWAYVPISFHTTEGLQKLEDNEEYEALHEKEVIIHEMTKRQLKKWLKSSSKK